MIPEKVDITSLASERLTSVFKGKQNIENVLKTFTDYLNELDNGIHDLLNYRGISSSVGVQLDLIGKIVEEPRLGKSDDDYRQALYLKAISNNSEGSPEDLLASLRIFTKAPTVEIWEHYPASTHLYTDGVGVSRNTPNKIKDAAPAGTRVPVILHDTLGNGFTPSEIYTGPSFGYLVSWPYPYKIETDGVSGSSTILEGRLLGLLGSLDVGLDAGVEGLSGSAEILTGGTLKGTAIPYDIRTFDLDRVSGWGDVLTGGVIKTTVIQYDTRTFDTDQVTGYGAILAGGEIKTTAIPYDTRTFDLERITGSATILTGGSLA